MLGHSFIFNLGHFRTFSDDCSDHTKFLKETQFWKIVRILHALIFKASPQYVPVVAQSSYSQLKLSLERAVEC